MSVGKLVFKSTTGTSLNDRFSKLMKNRPDESARTLVDESGVIRQGSAKNRRYAEDLERKNAQIGRKPLSARLGVAGQRDRMSGSRDTGAGRSSVLGRIGKKPAQSNFQANRALKRAQDMLRETERELNNLKRGNGPKKGKWPKSGKSAGKEKKPALSQDTLDKQMDEYMMKTKGGLDAQMDEYMSKTKSGLDKQMDDYMATKE